MAKKTARKSKSTPSSKKKASARKAGSKSAGKAGKRGKTKKSAAKAKAKATGKVVKKKTAKTKVVKKKVAKKQAAAPKPRRAAAKPATKTPARKKTSKRAARAKTSRPRPTGKKLTMFRRMLVDKHKNLFDAYLSNKGSSRESTSDGTEDYIDYAVNSYARDFTLSLSEMERKQMLLVEEALKRIDRREYGLCQQCGQTIPEKRLEVEPWARHCIRCQELEEQGLLQGLASDLDADDSDEDDSDEDDADEDDSEKDDDESESGDLEEGGEGDDEDL